MRDPSSRPLAVVTGASTGVGFELARQFAEHGFDLMIVAEDAVISSAADSLRVSGTVVDALQADLATREGAEQAYQGIRATGRPVEVIALTGGAGVQGPFVDTDLEDELRLINLNVTSIVHLAKLVTRDMISRRRGRVLITSSVTADFPGAYRAVDSASRAFALAFADALRNEFKDTGVTVTALDPGAVAREGFEALITGKDHIVAE